MYTRKHSIFPSDRLLEILKDGKGHTVAELISLSGYKNRISLKEGVSRLRSKGKDIKPYNDGGHLKYKMEVFSRGDYWSCMIPKMAWPVCYGNGCRHRDKCEAVVRR